MSEETIDISQLPFEEREAEIALLTEEQKAELLRQLGY